MQWREYISNIVCDLATVVLLLSQIWTGRADGESQLPDRAVLRAALPVRVSRSAPKRGLETSSPVAVIVMATEGLIPELARAALECTTFDGLKSVLSAAAREMGFEYYAISRHAGRNGTDQTGQIHNYPHGWESRYVAEQLGRRDPVHRACGVRASGFRWRDARTIIPFAAGDDAMLHEAKTFGIDEGFTIPANTFGAARGSVTFATLVGDPFPEHQLFAAQGFGNIVFQAVLDIGWRRHLPAQEILTERQLECVLWVGRGKSNWEIATILGISLNTVKKHLHDACERYELLTRTSLPLRALSDGSLSIDDIFP